MDLENFVQESLNQIFNGVKGAQESAAKSGGEINPKVSGKGTFDHTGRIIHPIEFDVAVTVVETGNVNGGISVMGVGLKGASSESNTSVSRIKFNVPISLPK
jgi:hypothetical protein